MVSLVFMAVFLVTTALVWKYKELSLYVLFLGAYTQNFVIGFLYTKGFIGADMARGLILFKDFLLLELFVWSFVVLITTFRRPWPRPLKPLLVLTIYCGFRFLVGVILFDDDFSQGLYRLRNIFFPLEILVVVMVLTALKPGFGQRFLRHITWILSALGVVALAILFWAPPDFWVANANIAELQSDVKGSKGEADFEAGVLPNSTMSGRDTLQFLSMFRASGTFGEALALAFSMSVPVLLLSLYFRISIASVVALTAATGALFFSLTRSAWIFCFIVGAYVLVRRRKYRLLLTVGCAIVSFFILWPPAAGFIAGTISNLSLSSNSVDTAHAEGVRWFYTQGFSDLGNILGKGMRLEVEKIPECGYAYLLEHFGLAAYASFLWFCFSLYRQLRRAAPESQTFPPLPKASRWVS